MTSILICTFIFLSSTFKQKQLNAIFEEHARKTKKLLVIETYQKQFIYGHRKEFHH